MRDYLFHPVDPKSHTFSGKPATRDAIRAAEAQLGVRFPAAYVQVLLQQDGGYVYYNAYPTPIPSVSGMEPYVSVRSIAGISGSASILRSPQLIAEWEMPDKLLLLDGDGHTWICLDYRVCGPEGEPSVTWIDNELEQDVQIAPDFTTFITHLVYESDRYEYGFVGVGDNLDKLLRQLSKGFGVTFEKMRPLPKFHTSTDYRAIHPEWKSSLGAHNQVELWVCSNRGTDGHYDHPMYPECDQILQCDIECAQRTHVEAIIRQHGSFEIMVIHIPRWPREEYLDK